MRCLEKSEDQSNARCCMDRQEYTRYRDHQESSFRNIAYEHTTGKLQHTQEMKFMVNVSYRGSGRRNELRGQAKGKVIWKKNLMKREVIENILPTVRINVSLNICCVTYRYV